MSLTPAQRILRSRLGGLRTAQLHDPREYTAPARRAFAERFYVGIPETLPQSERDRRAEAARRAYFTKMALNREVARTRKKAGPDRDSGPATEDDGGNRRLPPAA
jgi:hypothetical protein